jgi:hypothetical protein
LVWFEKFLLAPATILGTPVEAGLNQKNSTSSRLRRDSGLKQLLIFYALPQQASLSQNAQWRSQNLFKPSVELCKLFWYMTPGVKWLSFNVITAT